jgi:hypothetical protein
MALNGKGSRYRIFYDSGQCSNDHNGTVTIAMGFISEKLHQRGYSNLCVKVHAEVVQAKNNQSARLTKKFDQRAVVELQALNGGNKLVRISKSRHSLSLDAAAALLEGREANKIPYMTQVGNGKVYKIGHLNPF